MEIKILCACGTKFKFDVEPVHGRMPAPAICPGCGADTTAEANRLIEAALASAPPPPIAAPPPESSAAPGAPPPPPRAAPMRAAPAPRKVESKSAVLKTLGTLLVFLCIGFGAWRFGSKWFRRLSFVAQVASVAGEASVDQSESSGPKNLWYEKCAVLFIRHTNHLEVAEALQRLLEDYAAQEPGSD